MRVLWQRWRARWVLLMCRWFGHDLDFAPAPREDVERQRAEILAIETEYSARTGRPIGVGKPAPTPPLSLSVLKCRDCGWVRP